jgi:sialic acid synthase SpsE
MNQTAVIVEIGIHYNGDMPLTKRLIDVASLVGRDIGYANFQK